MGMRIAYENINAGLAFLGQFLEIEGLGSTSEEKQVCGVRCRRKG